jgi:CO dehydrogenase/acetyl-CoA synthase epsilon subunit
VDNFDAKIWTEKIRQYKTPLVVAGQGCSEIRLNGKPLSDFAVDVAEKLGCPVAATGNAILSMGEAGSKVEVKKMWLAELFRYLEDDWQEPLTAEKPDLLLTIGFHPELLEGMAAGMEKVDMIHLGPGAVTDASLNMEAVPLGEWAENLGELIRELARLPSTKG